MDNENYSGRLKATRMTVLIGITVLILLLAVGAWEYVQSKLDKINYVQDANDQIEQAELEPAFTDVGGEKYFNILLLGTDERSEKFSVDARSDCTMLLSLNLKDHTAHLVSLERGIGVPIEGHEDDWLTHVFRYGGANLMLKTVEKQFDVDVDRYVRVNFYAFAEIIDAIGGVDITLTDVEAQALNGEIYTNATTKHPVHAGLNHLDGYDALQYARQRFIDDDWHRVQRQRTVLQAALEQTKHVNLIQIDNLMDKVLPVVQTNLTKKEINSLLPQVPFFLGVKLQQMTLPLPGTFGNKLTLDGRSLMLVDFAENAKLLHEFIYGDFDPASYHVPEEVTRRIAVAQQKAAQEWALAHPPKPSSTEETIDEEDEDEETELEPKLATSKSNKSKKTSSSSKSAKSKASSKQTAEEAELAELKQALKEKSKSSSPSSSSKKTTSKTEKTTKTNETEKAQKTDKTASSRTASREDS